MEFVLLLRETWPGSFCAGSWEGTLKPLENSKWQECLCCSRQAPGPLLIIYPDKMTYHMPLGP